MPTGYTADVQNGKITSFNDFAKQCARAFGACIMQRDDPADAPVKLPEASHYNSDQFDLARMKLARLHRMTPEEIDASCKADNASARKRNAKYAADKAEEKSRYEAMLQSARAWLPPSKDHDEFKKFMVSQLEESIRFDCGSLYTEKDDYSPVEWYDKQVADCERNIEYHKKEAEAEEARTAGRRKWITDLFQSLGVKISP
jgi:hypothetical protein